MEAIKESKKKLTASGKKALFILFFLVFGSLFFKSEKVLLGVFIGGVLSLINIVVLSKIGEKVFQQSNPSKTPAIITYIIKLIILFGVLFILVNYEVVNIFAFIIGYSTILLTIGLGSILPSQKTTSY